MAAVMSQPALSSLPLAHFGCFCSVIIAAELRRRNRASTSEPTSLQHANGGSNRMHVCCVCTRGCAVGGERGASAVCLLVAPCFIQSDNGKQL